VDRGETARPGRIKRRATEGRGTESGERSEIGLHGNSPPCYRQGEDRNPKGYYTYTCLFYLKANTYVCFQFKHDSKPL
jgi:hypothetical protein